MKRPTSLSKQCISSGEMGSVRSLKMIKVVITLHGVGEGVRVILSITYTFSFVHLVALVLNQ